MEPLHYIFLTEKGLDLHTKKKNGFACCTLKGFGEPKRFFYGITLKTPLRFEHLYLLSF